MPSDPIQFDVATPNEQRAAMELVLRSVAPSARSGLIDAVAAQTPERLGALDALIVARAPAGVVGATWAQPSPGQAAALWPPETTDDAPKGVVEGLLAEVLRRTEIARVVMVQVLFETDEDARIAPLKQVGFERIAELLYMERSLQAEDAKSGGQKMFRFEPYEESHFDRLKRALQATYVKSLDCPGMEGRRDQEGMLAGYRATGQYNPSDWFFVQSPRTAQVKSSQDDGVLLLAEHPASRQYELVYMGVASHARGQGMGRAIVDEAIRVSAQRGAEQLMVAVDATNTPARRLYEAASFSPWARRFVYVR